MGVHPRVIGRVGGWGGGTGPPPGSSITGASAIAATNILAAGLINVPDEVNAIDLVPAPVQLTTNSASREVSRSVTDAGLKVRPSAGVGVMTSGLARTPDASCKVNVSGRPTMAVAGPDTV